MCGKTYEQPPNIVWILMDDLSCRLWCYGEKGVYTSNFDKFQGIRFTTCFRTVPGSSLSRPAKITGFYRNYTGAQLKNSEKEAGLTIIPHTLEEWENVFELWKQWVYHLNFSLFPPHYVLNKLICIT